VIVIVTQLANVISVYFDSSSKFCGNYNIDFPFPPLLSLPSKVIFLCIYSVSYFALELIWVYFEGSE